jgi:hypothetical protein
MNAILKAEAIKSETNLRVLSPVVQLTDVEFK